MTINLTTLMAGSTSTGATVALGNTYVAVGTGSSISGSANLTWDGTNFNANGPIGAVTLVSAGRGLLVRAPSGDATPGILQFTNNAVTVQWSSLAATNGTLTCNSAFSATGEVTAYSSDKRLKTDIRPITNAVDKVKLLNGIIYRWNSLAGTFGFDQTQELVGLFAQEVEAVLPEAIKPAPFDTTDGISKSGENYLTVQYEKLVPLLIEAIKEQQTMITKQQQQIDQIQATMAELLNK